MKGKLSTKAIVISVVTVLLLGTAITGTVLFLKDSGEAAAASEENQSTVLPVAGDGTEGQTEPSSNNQEPGNGDTVAQPGTTTATVNPDGTLPATQGPAASILEVERVAAQTTELGWSGLDASNKDAEFDRSIIFTNYTVTYLPGEEGTFEAQVKEGLVYGDETPDFEGEKTGTPGYAFIGWIAEDGTEYGIEETLPPVTGDATYVAKWEQIKYTVTWVNYNGDVLEEDTGLIYGDVPEYNGETPTKAVDAAATYTFKGWDKEIVPVTEDTVYTATYTANTKTYTIKFYKSGNGGGGGNCVTETGYTSEDTIDLSPRFSYGHNTFYAWSTKRNGEGVLFTESSISLTELVTIFGYTNLEETEIEIKLYARWQHGGSTGEYTVYVTFYNDDGSGIKTQILEHGDKPSCEEPSKEATAEFTYEFAGWEAEDGTVYATADLPEATDDTSYTAKYTKTTRKYAYKINFIYEGLNEGQQSDESYTFNGEEEYGKTVTVSSQLIQDNLLDGYYHKSTSPAAGIRITENTENNVINVTYSRVKYTVTFENYDGTQLQSKEYKYGATPSYTGATPTKPKDAQYTYTFDKWEPEIVPVTGNKTYTATFSQALNQYTITWKNYDGSTLETSTVEHGSTPSYPGETIPTRPDDEQYTYTFDKWEPEIVAATEDTSYTATYNKEALPEVTKYTITWKDYDGSVLKTDSVEEGTVPSCPDPTRPNDTYYTYTFAGWDKEIIAAAEDTVYTATYTKKIISGDAVTTALQPHVNETLNISTNSDNTKCILKFKKSNSVTLTLKDSYITGVYKVDSNGNKTGDNLIDDGEVTLKKDTEYLFETTGGNINVLVKKS